MAEQQLVCKVACGRRDYSVLPYSPLEKCDFAENKEIKMATKDGWNNKFTISGVLNLDDGIIAIERGDDEPVVLADSIDRLNGKDVIITVTCEEPT